jgi:hypothetical protein
LGSGLNAGNIGAEIDVIQPGLPAQPHALGFEWLQWIYWQLGSSFGRLLFTADGNPS